MIKLKKIQKEQLLQGMNLALKNARSFLKEANLLAKNKAYSRAFALGVLSIEEVGKVVLFALCYHKDRFATNQKISNRFSKLLSKHCTKISFFEDYYCRKWKSFLYLLHEDKHYKKTQRSDEGLIKQFIKSFSDVYGYLEKMGLSSIIELKLKCLYIDSSKNGLEFLPPYKPPLKVVESLLFLTKHHIKDGEELRDAFRRAKTTNFSEQLYMTMFKDYELRMDLEELEMIENENDINI